MTIYFIQIHRYTEVYQVFSPDSGPRPIERFELGCRGELNIRVSSRFGR